jgi:pilus assembly protein CpaB
MGRRTLLLVAALVVAALGTTGIFLYVNGVDQRAEAGYDLVDVLVASTTITPGTSAQDAEDSGVFEIRPFIASSVEGLPALSNISEIADKVALSPIAAGSPILATQFGNPGESAVLPIPKGKLAVSLTLDDPQRVAGFVEPGSSVVVFLTAAAGAGGGQVSTRVLLTDVPVIAAGATTVVSSDTATGEEVSKALLTVAVDQEDAQKLVYAQNSGGTITFGLINQESKIDPADPGASADNLFNN